MNGTSFLHAGTKSSSAESILLSVWLFIWARLSLHLWSRLRPAVSPCARVAAESFVPPLPSDGRYLSAVGERRGCHHSSRHSSTAAALRSRSLGSHSRSPDISWRPAFFAVQFIIPAMVEGTIETRWRESTASVARAVAVPASLPAVGRLLLADEVAHRSSLDHPHA